MSNSVNKTLYSVHARSLLVLPLIQAHANGRHEHQIDPRRAVDVVRLAIRHQLTEIHEAPRDARNRTPTQGHLCGAIHPIALQMQRDGRAVRLVREIDLAFAGHEREFAFNLVGLPLSQKPPMSSQFSSGEGDVR